MTEKEFKEIFDRDHKSMVYFAKKMIGDLLADDVVTEAFVELWKRGKISDANTFLGGCVKNKCYNIIKLNKVHRRNNKMLLYLFDEFSAAVEIKSDLMRLIAEQINNLPGGQREIIILKYKGLEYKEISDKIGISINTVRVQYNRALDNLRKFVGNTSTKEDRELFCRNGHRMTEENSRTDSKGTTWCRKCANKKWKIFTDERRFARVNS